jgi:hypothetical protein
MPVNLHDSPLIGRVDEVAHQQIAERERPSHRARADPFACGGVRRVAHAGVDVRRIGPGEQRLDLRRVVEVVVVQDADPRTGRGGDADVERFRPRTARRRYYA